jgi:hypothetical protein
MQKFFHRLIAICTASGLVLGYALPVGAASTSWDPMTSSFTNNGAPFFPIGLSWPPAATGTTPSGGNAIAEVTGAGVNLLRDGAHNGAWNDSWIAQAQQMDQVATQNGALTWPNLRELGSVAPGSTGDVELQKVVNALSPDPALGMWLGAGEPWWNGLTPSQLQYPYCEVTGHGCSLSGLGSYSVPTLDSNHDWTLMEAPRGTASDLAPYTQVTDSHGVDDYPVTLNAPNGPLHDVGTWTATLYSITHPKPVLTSMEICSSGQADLNGNFILPTFAQERFMTYDAILNGASGVNYFGGQDTNCWNSTDTTSQWSWTFWYNVLKPLIQQISSSSPLAPALSHPTTPFVVSSSDPSTEVISRPGSSGSDWWVIAGRYGTGSAPVTISGLPGTVNSSDVYTENRSVPVSGGSLTDTFNQYDVHVYHLTQSQPTSAPAITSFTPSSGPAGTQVTVSGSGFTGTSQVTLGGASATYTVHSDTQLSLTVPPGAVSGPVVVTNSLGSAQSQPSFTVTVPPRVSGFSPSSGPVGTQVALTGSGFTGATKVSVNGAAASFTVSSDTQLSLTVPSGASSGPIAVSSSSGTGTSATSFTVTVPTFSISASPLSAVVTRGKSVNFAVKITPSGGFASPVSLSVKGLPAGASGTFLPNPTSTNAATLTVTTTNTTAVGTFTVTITGTSSTVSHAAIVSLQVKKR